jgi:7-carboxy-7-deazaguanine synthase
MINISEIFYSLQGESSYMGFPCIFIRFAGCNLRCSYCDSTFSYETKDRLTVEQILQQIRKFKPVKLIEITGGEPLLQNEVYNLIKELNSENYNILLETNGSIDLQNVPKFVIKIVDIKCPTSGYGNSFLKKNLQFINETDELKFVISDNRDYIWAKKFIETNNLKNMKSYSPLLPILWNH